MPTRYKREFRIQLDPGDREPVPFEGGMEGWKEAFEAGLKEGSIEADQCPELPETIARAPELQAGLKRYRLRYIWDPDGEVLGVVSCNPSLANIHRLDDTLANTTRQAHIWGFGGVDQSNLSPNYGTIVSEMLDRLELDDPCNNLAIAQVLKNPETWLAWGARPNNLRGERAKAWNAAEDRVYRQVLLSGTKPLVRRLSQPSGPKKAVATGYRAPSHPQSRGRLILSNNPLCVRIVRVSDDRNAGIGTPCRASRPRRSGC